MRLRRETIRLGLELCITQRDKIHHLNSILAKSDMLSLTDSAWESQNDASWDTVLLHMSYWIHTNLHSYGTVGYSEITVNTSRCTMRGSEFCDGITPVII